MHAVRALPPWWAEGPRLKAHRTAPAGHSAAGAVARSTAQPLGLAPVFTPNPQHNPGSTEALVLFDRREYERLIAAPDITHMAAPQSWTVTHVRYRLPSPPSGDLADEETLARWVRSLVATQERFARHFTAPSPGFPYLPLVWDVHLAPVHLARLERYDTGDEDVPPPPRWARLDDFACHGWPKMHSLPVARR